MWLLVHRQRRLFLLHSSSAGDVLAFTTSLGNMHRKLRCQYLIVFGWWIILTFKKLRNFVSNRQLRRRPSRSDYTILVTLGPSSVLRWEFFPERVDVEVLWQILHRKKKQSERHIHHPIGIVELKIVEVEIRKSSTWLGLEMGWRVWEGGVWLLWISMAYWHWGILRLFNFWQKRDGKLKFSTSCLSPTPWLFSESFIGFHISQTGHEIFSRRLESYEKSDVTSLFGMSGLRENLPEILTLTAAKLADRRQVREDLFRDTLWGFHALGGLERTFQWVSVGWLGEPRRLKVG